MWWPRPGWRADDARRRASGLAGRSQPHSDAPAAVQVAGLGGGLAELAAQPRQVDVDGAVAAAVRLAPHLREQLTLRHHLAGSLGQREQQVELLAGQLELAVL